MVLKEVGDKEYRASEHYDYKEGGFKIVLAIRAVIDRDEHIATAKTATEARKIVNALNEANNL